MKLFAYVDPGVGATLLQLALAGVAGLAVMFRLQWRRLKRLTGKTDEDAESDVTADDCRDRTRFGPRP